MAYDIAVILSAKYSKKLYVWPSNENIWPTRLKSISG